MNHDLAQTFIPLKDLEECATYFGEACYYQILLDSEHKDLCPDYDTRDQDVRDPTSPNDWATRGVFCTNGEALCQALGGHDLIDRSSAGPDSGDMDCECMRCGQYFHHQLY